MAAKYRRLGLCLAISIVAVAVVFAMTAVVHAQARRQATRILDRAKQVASPIEPPIPGMPKLLKLAESEQAVTLLIRSTVRFAIEFAKFDDVPPEDGTEGMNQAAVERFWDATSLAHIWSDVLHQRIQDGEIHQDVIAPHQQGNLSNLQVQHGCDKRLNDVSLGEMQRR